MKGVKGVKGMLQWLVGINLLFATAMTLAAPQAEILEYGYYEFTDAATRSLHPAVASGYVQSGEAELVKQTLRIPIEEGRLFGFRFRISVANSNVGLIPLELKVTHPLMNEPDGTSSTGYRYNLDLKMVGGVVEDKAGYQMNQPYEMVEGDWVFEYRFMNKPILVQRFTTYKP